MNNEVSNSDIMKKIGSIIYKDKVRILIALVASIASYYFTLYPSDRLSFIVDGIANKEGCIINPGHGKKPCSGF